jgi:hypothetical protein
MRLVIVLTVAVLLAGSARTVVAETPPNELGALERKLVGAWKGETSCDGSFLFRADGTYELTGYGPAPYDSAGTWKLRGDVLPALLILTRKTSDIPCEVGKALELRLNKLDDKNLVIEYAHQDANPPGRYARGKK